MDRRQFLLATGAAGAAMSWPYAAFAQEAAPPRERGHSSFYVDAQGGLDGIAEPEPGVYVPSQALKNAIRQRRIDLISGTVGPVGNGDDRYRDAVEGIAEMDRMIAGNADLVAKI